MSQDEPGKMADHTKKLREQIIALDAKIDAERMPEAKERLRLALHKLEDFERTVTVTALEAAVDAPNEVVQAIGGRPPEEIEELPLEAPGFFAMPSAPFLPLVKQIR